VAEQVPPADDGAGEEDASQATPSERFWNRPLFALGGGMVPELLLLFLGWMCTALELFLQWQGAAAITLNSPGVIAIAVLVALMMVIWVGNTVKKFAFDGEFSSADVGSLFLVVASTSALFWAHHLHYYEVNNRNDVLPPVALLIGSIVLQVIATWILLRPWFRQK
jgi:hypothetical protein